MATPYVCGRAMNPSPPRERVDSALSEVAELATRLRGDLDLAISTVDAVLAEVGEARAALADSPTFADLAALADGAGV